MVVSAFPPVETADSNGIVAIGGDLEVPTLELAYRNGIFPWPHQGYPLLWFAPPKRAILEFDDLKVTKRLLRYFKKTHFQFRTNTRFLEVIQACAMTPRKGQPGTWITEEIITAYLAFHKAGFAHSFEVLDSSDHLVGGLYGVKMGKMFCGESMFHTVSHASKYAFIKTVEQLKTQGSTWMDVQLLTPLLASLGAKELDRADFMHKLRETLRE